jgi:hypothetical protein
MANDDLLGTALGEARRETQDRVAAVWQAQMDRMRDALSRDWHNQISRVIDERFAEFEASMRPKLLEARREVVRSFCRHWNECFQRMRDSATDREWCDALLDAAGGLSKRCLFFSIKGNTLAFQGSRGFEGDLAELAQPVPADSWPAFLDVLMSGTAAEISLAASDLPTAYVRLAGEPDARALLVPIHAGERVAGMVYVESGLDKSALEAIALVAGLILTRRLSVDEMPRLSSVIKSLGEDPAPAPVVTSTQRRPSNPRAERAARVAASRLLLDRYAEVRKARISGDVYTPFKEDIDRMRQEFGFPGDILEAELLRTLAHGKRELMGGQG